MLWNVWISVLLFSGEESAILLTREYFQEYSCDFILYYYPFDTQVSPQEKSI